MSTVSSGVHMSSSKVSQGLALIGQGWRGNNLFQILVPFPRKGDNLSLMLQTLAVFFKYFFKVYFYLV